MVSTADMSDTYRLEDSMSEDLDPKWNEPSTRGDLRLLAMRIDTKFDQLRGDFRILSTNTDAKFDNFRAEFTRTMYRGGMIFSGAIITANLAMLSIFATLIK